MKGTFPEGDSKTEHNAKVETFIDDLAGQAVDAAFSKIAVQLSVEKSLPNVAGNKAEKQASARSPANDQQSRQEDDVMDNLAGQTVDTAISKVAVELSAAYSGQNVAGNQPKTPMHTEQSSKGRLSSWAQEIMNETFQRVHKRLHRNRVFPVDQPLENEVADVVDNLAGQTVDTAISKVAVELSAAYSLHNVAVNQPKSPVHTEQSSKGRLSSWAKEIMYETFQRVHKRLHRNRVFPVDQPFEDQKGEDNMPIKETTVPTAQEIIAPESSKDTVEEGFIRLADTRLEKSNADVFVVDLSAVPQRKSLKKKDKKMCKDNLNSLCGHAQSYIEKTMRSDTFVVLIHSSEEDRTGLPSKKLAHKFYKLLKERFSDNLLKCVILKPSFKLKALVLLGKPFLKKGMRSKIQVASNVSKFLEEQGLPDSILAF